MKSQARGQWFGSLLTVRTMNSSCYYIKFYTFVTHLFSCLPNFIKIGGHLTVIQRIRKVGVFCNTVYVNI